MNSQMSYIPTSKEVKNPKPYVLPKGLPTYLTIDEAINQAPNISLKGDDLFHYNAKQFFARGITEEVYHWLHPTVSEAELPFMYSSSHVSDIFRWGFHLRKGSGGEPISWNRPSGSVATMDAQTYGLAYLVTLATFAKEEDRQGTIQQHHDWFQQTLYWKFVEMAPHVRYQVETKMAQTVSPVPEKTIEEAVKKTA
jgi:hypothetical protein